MKILTSSYTLDLAGVPTFTKTFFDEVKKRGDEIVVYSPLGGRLSSQMETVESLKDLKFVPDIIVSQHTPCSYDLKDKFPNVRHIFYSHGLLPEIEQPPKFEADYYFAINKEVQENLIKSGVNKSKIAIVRDFIDTEKFKKTKETNQKLTNVLFISNYKKWKNYKIVSQACQILGVNLKCSGAPYGRSNNIEQTINDSDLVISWGRGILEALSCERNAISFDKTVGDGFIDNQSYFESRENNFSGRVFNISFTPLTLSQEMQKYDKNIGAKNRDLILKYHQVKKGVDLMYEYFRNSN